MKSLSHNYANKHIQTHTDTLAITCHHLIFSWKWDVEKVKDTAAAAVQSSCRARLGSWWNQKERVPGEEENRKWRTLSERWMDLYSVGAHMDWRRHHCQSVRSWNPLRTDGHSLHCSGLSWFITHRHSHGVRWFDGLQRRHLCTALCEQPCESRGCHGLHRWRRARMMKTPSSLLVCVTDHLPGFTALC